MPPDFAKKHVNNGVHCMNASWQSCFVVVSSNTATRSNRCIETGKQKMIQLADCCFSLDICQHMEDSASVTMVINGVGGHVNLTLTSCFVVVPFCF
jgi:hypothetical protein